MGERKSPPFLSCGCIPSERKQNHCRPAARQGCPLPRVGLVTNARTDLRGTGVVAKDLGREGLEGRTLAPGVGRKARLAASLLEEGIAVPIAFDRNLGQQKAAAGT